MKRRSAGILAVLSVLLLGACSGSDVSESSPEPAATQSGSASTEGSPVTITAREYSFDIPTLSAGSNEIVLENDGAQAHMLVILKLSDGKTSEDLLDYVAEHGMEGKQPPWAEPVGFGVADPGTSSPVGPGEGEPKPGAVIALESGDYMAVCFIPDGMMSSSQKPPKDAELHAALGMVQDFTVA